MAVILIVEDDAIIRELAGMLLQDLGHDIHAASDVEEALLILRSARRIDALFTDIHLKEAVLGGCSVARQAIELRPGLLVLYTTGNAMTDELRAGFISGSSYLRKPYTHHQLRNSVDLLLAA